MQGSGSKKLNAIAGYSWSVRKRSESKRRWAVSLEALKIKDSFLDPDISEL
jgi:hypothetical protein